MMSKAAKRRARRVVIVPGPREPNGRLSRRKANKAQRQQQETRATMAPAVEARMRIFGMTEEAAKQRESGSVIGRMIAPDSKQDDGTITMAQFMALESIRDAHNAFQRAVGIDAPDTGNPPPAPVFERSGDYEGFVASAKDKWADITKMIKEAAQAEEQATGRRPLAWAALYKFVIEDQYDRTLIGDLRLAANAVVRRSKPKMRAWLAPA